MVGSSRIAAAFLAAVVLAGPALSAGPRWIGPLVPELRLGTGAAELDSFARPSGGLPPRLPAPLPPADGRTPPAPPRVEGGGGPPPVPSPVTRLDFPRPASRRAAGHVVVRFAPGLPGWQRRQIAAAAGGAWFDEALSGAFARVGVAPGETVAELAAALRGVAGVESAEADPLVWPAAVEVAVAEVSGAPAGGDFDDPHFPLQWVFERIRLEEGVELNPSAGDGVVVAVIDSGVASGNGARFPQRRGVDLATTRFLPGLDLVGGGPALDEGSGDPFDRDAPRFGHGTYVAAQIAAAVDNGVAGASVAPRAVILPIRIIGTNGRGTTSDLAEAIDFAVSQGARVINMSLQGFDDTAFLREAVGRAAAAGVVLVASAGNLAQEPEFDGEVSLPARYPQVIAVGATDFGDGRASYSSFGPSLELMAPAGEDTELVTDVLRDAALAPSFLHDPVTGDTLYASFWATGTSFAAPQVAGAAALLIALGVDHPEVLRQLLTATTRDLGPAGFDEETAHGLLDLLETHRGLGLAF